ncbi:MTH1187 family thiamine-binding protein [Paenibacillus sp. N1-5-1-14]|uniref:MTH1187 family thiamine-binding protein n=1 Tax=Paenibacillus radicibacter TaxID=2972488 RepID=UPI0021596879|nr:MTH1187 family thiamine-binding protein [Paenibacillus radicibacter]MCR8642074.1 MTH1187 family thiamine-binding protein [Paenibacillus radicibacter]
MANALVSIQIIPKTRSGEDVIPYVDRAIEVIQQSGVKYMVSPLETTMEGDLSELLDIVKRMNEVMIEVGCPGVLSQVKIAYNPEKGYTMDQLTEKYRG